MDAQHIKALDQANVMGTYGRGSVLFVRGQGVHLWDADGKRYLDFLSGLAVNGLGHCPPRVVEAICKQAGTLLHTSNLFLTEPQAVLAEKLVAISQMERVFFCNSGAEANEAAIKIARKYGKKDGRTDKFTIITAQRSFHGRTMATITATAQPKYQKPFEPMLTGFRYVPFNDVAALEAAMDDSVCAVLLEPIQGEGGIYPATQDYLNAARKLCDQLGALLMFDEVQCGMARTGSWFAHQNFGVQPDVMSLAKSLGGGLPIGACLARGEAGCTLVPGDHASTFGGNPVVAAAANAVIDTIIDDKLLDNAHKMGLLFVQRLRDELAPHITEIRGLGLMIGVELNAPVAKQIVSDALQAGLVINAVGDTILRLLPPLIITETDIEAAVAVLKHVMKA